MTLLRPTVVRIFAGAALAALAASATLNVPAAEASQRVIVQATSSSAAAAAVVASGGRVTARLPIVHGVAAEIRSTGLARLARATGVRAVTPNDPVQLAETASAVNESTVNSVFSREVGADSLWSRGITGAGVTVALIDTGVQRVSDLANRVVAVPDPDAPKPADGKPPLMAPCANFSGEGRSTAADCRDPFGHGTFMAGLIAGDGTASNGTYRGTAPGASIADIKIAGASGAADVSKVVAALQYVVAFKNDITPPVRVVNLSLGTTSRQDFRVDPLNYAVERAWNAGLAVVVSAGNTGPGAATISKPADDPLVITVGAIDDRESPGTSDDRLPLFSARGPATFDGTPVTVPKPDVVAPGGRVISLRPVDSSGSPLPTTIPAPAAGSWYSNFYRRGSGTSMSAAIVSGLAALYAQARGAPWSTADPDRFKAALRDTAIKVAERSPDGIGAGLVDASAATARALADTRTTFERPYPAAEGTGSLAASRGQAVVSQRDCTELERVVRMNDLDPNTNCPILIEGEQTAQGHAWDGAEFAGQFGSSWYGSSWYGSSWYGSSWYGSSWYGSSWYGSSWYGSYEGDTNYGTAVNGSSWYGAWG